MAIVRYNEAQGWAWLHTPTLNISLRINPGSLTSTISWCKYVTSRLHKLGFCRRSPWQKVLGGYEAEFVEKKYHKRRNTNETNVIAIARVR